MDQLSKKQQKKLLKKQQIKERFKEKKILKKQIKKQQPIPQKEKNDDQDGIKKLQNKRTKDQYKELMKDAQKIIIDLQFTDKMVEKEKVSLYKQIELCHSMNFKSEKPLNLILTSQNEEMGQLLAKSNSNNWGISQQSKHYLELFDKDQLVYLTGDAEETITELDKDKIYIIGGIVDHNRLKSITLNQSILEQIQARKFPINVDLKTSTILTVNQVYEILLYVNNGLTWDEAILKAIPKRKINN